jgi:hypothetical protein
MCSCFPLEGAVVFPLRVQLPRPRFTSAAPHQDASVTIVNVAHSALAATQIRAGTCDKYVTLRQQKRVPNHFFFDKCQRKGVAHVLSCLSNATLASAAATLFRPSNVCRPDSLACSDSARARSVAPASHRREAVRMVSSLSSCSFACLMSKSARCACKKLRNETLHDLRTKGACGGAGVIANAMLHRATNTRHSVHIVPRIGHLHARSQRRARLRVRHGEIA